MEANLVAEDRLFERRHNETRSMSTALQLYQKANSRALLAMQELSGALTELTLSISRLTQGEEMSQEVKSVAYAAYKDVSGFSMSNGYIGLSTALSDKVKRYATTLSQDAEKLKVVGKERKAARDDVEKYAKRRVKDEKLQARFVEVKAMLAVKEQVFSSLFENWSRLREEYVPAILKTTLQASHDYMAELLEILNLVKDCTALFADCQSAHKRSSSNPAAVVNAPVLKGSRGSLNRGSRSKRPEPLFSTEEDFWIDYESTPEVTRKRSTRPPPRPPQPQQFQQVQQSLPHPVTSAPEPILCNSQPSSKNKRSDGEVRDAHASEPQTPVLPPLSTNKPAAAEVNPYCSASTNYNIRDISLFHSSTQ